MNKFLLYFIMGFVGAGYFLHNQFSTGEFWTMMIITISAFAIVEEFIKLRKSIELNKGDELNEN